LKRKQQIAITSMYTRAFIVLLSDSNCNLSNVWYSFRCI